MRKPLIVVVLLAIAIFSYSKFISKDFDGKNQFGSDEAPTELRVLAYSSFTASWGPGPALAILFENQMRLRGQNVDVVFQQAEDAGMLLAKMDAFPADVVIGFDQLGLRLARSERKWVAHGIKNSRYSDDRFFAFDWAPLGFIYRVGEIEPPKNFADLLDSRFKGAIALQDPRSSSPGFQFLNWLVKVMGEDQAFAYLAKLKPNVHSVSPSWSQAYGMFTRGLAKMTFSYATSVLYHRLSEKDNRYAFVKLPEAHPIQVEYAAIPETCQRCELAVQFLKFMDQVEAQNIIMNKNWMLPVNDRALTGTPFEAFVHEIGDLSPESFSDLLKDSHEPSALLKKWGEVGL